IAQPPPHLDHRVARHPLTDEFHEAVLADGLHGNEFVMEKSPLLLCLVWYLSQRELVLNFMLAIELAGERGDTHRGDAVTKISLARGEERLFAVPQVLPELPQACLKFRRRVCMFLPGEGVVDVLRARERLAD